MVLIWHEDMNSNVCGRSNFVCNILIIQKIGSQCYKCHLYANRLNLLPRVLRVWVTMYIFSICYLLPRRTRAVGLVNDGSLRLLVVNFASSPVVLFKAGNVVLLEVPVPYPVDLIWAYFLGCRRCGFCVRSCSISELAPGLLFVLR